jgi:putative hydrolase
MLQVDFHSHTLFSRCGLHTAVEMLTYAKSLGLKGLAITDHGPELKGHLTSVFFERLRDPVPGIRLLKGTEANLTLREGVIDTPAWLPQWADIVLVGIHDHLPRDLGSEKYTSMLLSAMRMNPCIDIIAHPDDEIFAIDIEAVAREAKNLGIALELNNSKALYHRIKPEATERMLATCKRIGCPIAVDSDAHALHEIGRDDEARELLRRTDFPESLIVNRNAESAFAFVESRKERKKR